MLQSTYYPLRHPFIIQIPDTHKDHLTILAKFSTATPTTENFAMPSLSLSSISKITPRKSLNNLMHPILQALTRPSFTLLVFLQLHAIRFNRNHWLWVDTTPPNWIQSNSLLAANLPIYSESPPCSKAASAVNTHPVLVQAIRETLYPCSPPFCISVKIHTSARQLLKTSLTLEATALRVAGLILEPAQMPLTLFTQPFSMMVTCFRDLIEGMITWTSPPPPGRYPLLTILRKSSLSKPYLFFRRGISSCWMESTELSQSSLVIPLRWMLTAVFENIATNKRYSRQYPMDRQVWQSKSNSTPSLLVTSPGVNCRLEPPFPTTILHPVEMLLSKLRKMVSYGLIPGGLSYLLSSSISTDLSEMMEQKITCLKLEGFLKVSINFSRKELQGEQTIY